jgi:magnesium transporter
MVQAPDWEAQRDELLELVEARRFEELRTRLRDLEPPDLAELMDGLPHEAEAVVFRILPRDLAADTFEYLRVDAQERLLRAMGDRDVAHILNDMSPDDRTALLEELPGKVTKRLLNLLSPEERSVATRLLGYPEDSVGRLMTPDYVAVKPHWTVADALTHIRAFGSDSETLNILYVTAPGGKLIDDLRMRELLLVDPGTHIEALMDRQFVALEATQDQEEAVSAFRRLDRTALPVTDTGGILVGIVTVDDVLDVAEEEATEDFHKLGGVESFDEPYLRVGIPVLVGKRARWLVMLFIGEMLTATAMGLFESEIAKAVVLSLFLPMIISSGGNSGSQAATLVTRAMALGQVTVRDWWRIMRREVLTGLALGGILGAVGFVRVSVWALAFGMYGPYWPLIAFSIFLSLIGVVLWGSLAGSLLPIVLKRMGADPASSSAPFVATLVDVTGIIIFFTVAATVLRGTLL